MAGGRTYRKGSKPNARLRGIQNAREVHAILARERQARRPAQPEAAAAAGLLDQGTRPPITPVGQDRAEARGAQG